MPRMSLEVADEGAKRDKVHPIRVQQPREVIRMLIRLEAIAQGPETEEIKKENIINKDGMSSLRPWATGPNVLPRHEALPLPVYSRPDRPLPRMGGLAGLKALVALLLDPIDGRGRQGPEDEAHGASLGHLRIEHRRT